MNVPLPNHKTPDRTDFQPNEISYRQGLGCTVSLIHKQLQKRSYTVNDTNAVIAVYNTHDDAEAGIRELHQSGFEMKKLSVVGKDFITDEQVVGYYNAGDRMKYWGKWGAFWGGLWGLLFGAAFFWVPGVGPLLVAGPAAAWIVAALEGAIVVSGLSVLGAALYSIGIPKDSILKYEADVKANKFLLVVHGSAEEAAKAKDVLSATEAIELTEHTTEPVTTKA